MVRNWISAKYKRTSVGYLTSFAELDFGEIHGLALNYARLGFGAGVLYLAVVILYSLAQNDARLGFSVMPVWSDTDTYTL